MSLEVAAGDLDVAKRGKHRVRNVMDGDAVDGDEHVLRLLAKWSGKEENVLDGG